MPFWLAQGLPMMPSLGLYCLKARVTPYMG